MSFPSAWAEDTSITPVSWTPLLGVGPPRSPSAPKQASPSRLLPSTLQQPPVCPTPFRSPCATSSVPVDHQTLPIHPFPAPPRFVPSSTGPILAPSPPPSRPSTP